MKNSEIRKVFQKYFTNQDHLQIPSSSLIPHKDPSLLFVNAGMNQFKDYFLGIENPPHPQVFSIQKCLRAGGKHNDLEQVGCSPHHHTFFEMMGYFSFGGYGKKEALYYALHFLTQQLGLPLDRLWVSVFKNDLETANFWKKNYHIPSEKIFFMDEKDNFWRMGKTGPCGPCSEIYYYNGPKKNPRPQDMMEIWNLVFMEFNEDSSGQKPLPTPCIDTGMGLERLTAILQEKSDNYHTDLFQNIISAIEKESKGYIPPNKPLNFSKKQTALRVIADHSRAIAFLIADGVQPGNEGPHYVLRRLIRRACFYNNQLAPQKNLLSRAVQAVIDSMGEFYNKLNHQQKNIQNTLTKEQQLFSHSLETGKSIFLQKIKTLISSSSAPSFLPPSLIWNLYSTHGLPMDLISLLAKEKNFRVPTVTLEQLKKEFEPDNKKSNFFKNKDNFKEIPAQVMCYLKDQKSTQFTGYQTHQDRGQIQLLFCTDTGTLSSKTQLKTNQTGWMVLDRTCFYPEGGGAIGDTGSFQTQSAKAQISDCQKAGNFIFHQVRVERGILCLKDSGQMIVHLQKRQLISTSHSATHLLNWSLRSLLGSHIQQMGSLVEPGKLRFDFNHPQALASKTLQKIEQKVNESIQANHKVFSTTHSYPEACKMGALSLAGEQYQSRVRVIRIGESLELCGGIHVQDSSQIIGFKIISETGVKSGVRRITAYTGDLFTSWKNLMEAQNKQLRKYLSLPIPKKPETIHPLIEWMTKKEQEIKTLKRKLKSVFKHSSTSSSQDISLTHAFFSPLDSDSTIPKSFFPFNFLIRQNEELRQYLKLPLLKDLNESENFWIPIAKNKEQEIESLKKQLKNLSSQWNIQQLIKKAILFQTHSHKAWLLNIKLPVKDTKILIEIGHSIKSKLSKPSVVIILGQGTHQHPLIIMSSPVLNTIHAGKLFKNLVIPFLKGKGGGSDTFAQGIIQNPSDFFQLEKKLLNSFKTL